jgi:predicted regulator of Ras-like GTPase activity (Roadblock/LC7/MglB family)
MSTEKTEFKSEKLERALRALHEAVEGIKATVIVNLDGLLVSAYPSSDNEDDAHINPTSSPQVAAMSATLVGLAIRVLRRLEQGEMKRLFMEAEQGQMVVYPAGESLLAVLVEKDTQMGKVIFAASKVCDEIKQILEYDETKGGQANGSSGPLI